MKDEKRNARRRMKRTRDRYLIDQFRLQAEIAFESNSTDALRRAIQTGMKVLAPQMNDDKRVKLVEALVACAYYGEPTVNIDEEDKNMIFINGSFSVKELAQKISW